MSTNRDPHNNPISFRQLVQLRTRADRTGEPETLTVSHSSLSSSGCSRRFMFYKLLQMSRSSGSYAGDVGNAMHAAYQEWLITRSERKALEKLLLAYPFQYGKSAFDQRSIEACVQTLDKVYAKHRQVYGDASLAVIQDKNGDNIPAIEVPFEIRLFSHGQRVCIYDRPVSYIGYIDSIFHKLYEQGVYFTQDLKTTTKRRRDYRPMWEYEEQTLPYQFVLANIVGDELKEFRSDIFCAFIDPQEPKVQHIPLIRTAYHVRDWARALYLDLQIKQQSAEHNWWPRNGKQCDTFSVCPYFDVCGKSESDALFHFMGKTEDGWGFPERAGRGDFDPLFVLDLDLTE